VVGPYIYNHEQKYRVNLHLWRFLTQNKQSRANSTTLAHPLTVLVSFPVLSFILDGGQGHGKAFQKGFFKLQSACCKTQITKGNTTVVKARALAGDSVLFLGQDTILSHCLFSPRCLNQFQKI